MPTAAANGIELYYETFGEPEDPPLVLVNGLGSQCVNYEVDFCEAFVDRGFFVIRFDNRDVGLSTKVEDSYLLRDMAADVVGLLDALGIDQAHIVGMSMGGMIVQQVAIDHPERVLTMTSIMSTTGDPDVGGATEEAMGTLMGSAANNFDDYIEHYLAHWRILAGPVHYDEARFRARGERHWERMYYPEGVARQILAIVGSGSRSEQLRSVDVPTLVIHGAIDPLVGLSGGERTAEVIPGAELLVFDDMGHDLPPALWSQYVEAITNHASKVRTTS